MIKVQFTFNGIGYSGELHSVHGAGTEVYHLMVDKFFWGRLQKVAGEWVFHSNREDRAVLAGQLGTYLVQ